MSLDDFSIITRPNKWDQQNWARSYYDIINNKTGKKYRFSGSDIFNKSPFFMNVLGDSADELSQEVINRENEIQGLKDKYLELYGIMKERKERGLQIPQDVVQEAEELFSQMHEMDMNIGNFKPQVEEEVDDTPEGFAQTAQRAQSVQNQPALTEDAESYYVPKQVNNAFRAPEVEAPHAKLNLKQNTVEPEDYYENMKFERAIIKCRFLQDLSKDGEGCTQSVTAGYINPSMMNDTAYRNILFSKPRRKVKAPGKSKKKMFMKTKVPLPKTPATPAPRKPSMERGECPNCGSEYQVGFDTVCWNCGKAL